MSDAIPFPEFRELLKHISKDHSVSRAGANKSHRRVMYVEPHIDMRTGHVFSVTLKGVGWQKSLYVTTNNPKPLLQRCHEFLDNHPEAEPEDTAQDNIKAKGVAQALVDIIMGQIGQHCGEFGAEFGVEELKFTVPVNVLNQAIMEKKNEKRTGNGVATGADNLSASGKRLDDSSGNT